MCREKQPYKKEKIFKKIISNIHLNPSPTNAQWCILQRKFFEIKSRQKRWNVVWICNVAGMCLAWSFSLRPSTEDESCFWMVAMTTCRVQKGREEGSKRGRTGDSAGIGWVLANRLGGESPSVSLRRSSDFNFDYVPVQ